MTVLCPIGAGEASRGHSASAPDGWTYLDLVPDPVVIIDGAIRLVWANEAASDAFGWTLEQLQGHPVAGLVHRDDMITALASFLSVRSKAVGTLVEIRIRTSAGSYRTFEVRGRATGTDDTILVLRDVTDRHGWDIARGDPEVLRAVLDHAPGVTMLLDDNGLIRGATRALTTRLERPLDGTIGCHVRELVHLDDVDSLEGHLATAWSQHTSTLEARLMSTSAHAIPMSLTIANLIDDERVKGFVVTAIDISELVASRTQLEHLASHDDLTGVANRGAFFAHLAEVVDRTGEPTSAAAVVFCDVDNFKTINDRYGHLAGDAVLREVARRIVESVRASDLVARFGGDEFVILCEAAADGSTASLQRRLTAALEDPIDIGTRVVPVTITIGSAQLSAGMTPADVVAAADIAMYRAKRAATSASPEADRVIG